MRGVRRAAVAGRGAGLPRGDERGGLTVLDNHPALVEITPILSTTRSLIPLYVRKVLV